MPPQKVPYPIMATFNMHVQLLQGEQKKEVRIIYLHRLYTYAKLRYFKVIYLRNPAGYK